MSEAPVIRLAEAEIYERPVRFRFPFRFGAANVEATPQVFVRVRIVHRRGRSGAGWSAEMMMPKWFDKKPALTPDDSIDQLRGRRPMTEKSGYLAAHCDLYPHASGRTRPSMGKGDIGFEGALTAHGLGSAVEPDWSVMTPSAVNV
jgi:hypothetical protein